MKPSNEDIAEALLRVAELLEVQHASTFRVHAYRKAAQVVAAWRRPMAAIWEAEGLEGLDRIPGVGPRISSIIHAMLLTGRCPQLDRLRGQVSPEDLFATLPGVGEALARRIHHELDVETLEELEVAAHDGRLERVPGVGPRRSAMIRRTLDSLLSRSTHRVALRPQVPGARPSVAVLLDVDEEYRRRSAAGELRRIAPRRFNPAGEAWLPVLHTERAGWSFTALFSNTARAHRLQRTHEWVVIFAERDGQEDRCTVVTERSGALAGRRVVRGREPECLEHWGVGVSLAP
jgi:hypothetical protein